MFKTIKEIKLANIKCGQNWLADHTMRYWRSEIESEVIDGDMFLFSIKFNDDSTKQYRSAVVKENGWITSLGPIEGYKTKEECLSNLENDLVGYWE